MRKPNHKWILLLMFPLIVSLVTISVEGPDEVTIFVDPPAIIDEALQSPSTFDVRINISTTEPVYSWQFNLSWNSSILTVTGYLLGTFLNAGNATNTTEFITGDLMAGWLLWSETAIGSDFPGKTGSGSLGNVTFQVADYGYTVLDIDHELTYVTIKNHFPPPPIYQVDPVKENGQFRNVIPGDIQGDTSGTSPDGDVDKYDFGSFAFAYGTTIGQPNYNPLADLNGDTSSTPPDGDVDKYDFGTFAINYGRTI